jgi:hypothetical protein
MMARVVGGERIALPNLKFLFCPRPSSLTGLIIFLKNNFHEGYFFLKAWKWNLARNGSLQMIIVGKVNTVSTIRCFKWQTASVTNWRIRHICERALHWDISQQ